MAKKKKNTKNLYANSLYANTLMSQVEDWFNSAKDANYFGSSATPEDIKFPENFDELSPSEKATLQQEAQAAALRTGHLAKQSSDFQKSKAEYNINNPSTLDKTMSEANRKYFNAFDKGNWYWFDDDDDSKSNRARTDWYTGVQRSYQNLNKEYFDKVKSGEITISQFKKLMDSQTYLPTVMAHDRNQFASTYGGFGGYDKNLAFGKGLTTKEGIDEDTSYMGQERRRMRQAREMQLAPGAYEQTRGNVLQGMNKNRAKKTLMGQY